MAFKATSDHRTMSVIDEYPYSDLGKILVRTTSGTFYSPASSVNDEDVHPQPHPPSAVVINPADLDVKAVILNADDAD